MKPEPTALIHFEENGKTYAPGDRLAGEYRLDGIDTSQVKSVEASVLWFTEGKGDEDMGVHAFWQLDSGEQSDTVFDNPHAFETILPNAPLSYDGIILKIRWCVRVRVLLKKGKDIVVQKFFHVGIEQPDRLYEA